MENLSKYLNSLYPFSEKEIQLLISQFEKKQFEKGQAIVQVGEIQKDLYFISKGVQYSAFESNKKLHIIAFTYPPGFCAIPDSFALQKPATYGLFALNDTQTLSITKTKLDELFNQSQQIERFFRIMTETVLSGMIQRHIELHSLTIEERFKLFCKRSPHLLQLVPHKYIASYLGIDPTNFSKLFNTIPF